MTDPVSDFLAREQDVLAELGDDLNSVILNSTCEINGVTPNNVFPLENGVLNSRNNSSTDLNTSNAHELNFSLPNGPTINANSNSMRLSNVSVDKEEPENLKKWRENQKKLIEEKDNSEEKKKQELREQAKKELEEWHNQRKIRLEQRKKENREREKQHFDRNEKNGDYNTWEKIAKLIETKSSRSTKDTTRMKSLFTLCAESAPLPKNQVDYF